MPVHPLDHADRRILHELDRNSRQHISELARTLRLGRDLVTYRIDRLKDRGILLKCSALIDPYRLGYQFTKTYLKLDANIDRRRAFELELHTHPRTYWLAECDGPWDMIWCILSANPLEVRELQSDLFSKYGNFILEFDISTNVTVDVFYKNFFIGKGDGGRKLGGVHECQTLDDFDRHLLRALASDARQELGALADMLSTSPAKVKNRIEKLELCKIIAGYRIDIDLAAIGMTFFKAQIFTKNFKKKDEERLCNYCDSHPHISHYIRQIGRCMIELEVDALDYPHFNGIMRELRENHSTFVRNTEAILIRRESYRWAI